jgi:hypothetical protein
MVHAPHGLRTKAEPSSPNTGMACDVKASTGALLREIPLTFMAVTGLALGAAEQKKRPRLLRGAALLQRRKLRLI